MKKLLEKMEKESQELNQEKPQSVSLTREAIFQRLRDMGIEVIDDTEEWEGTTYITTSGKPQTNSEENKEYTFQKESK